MRGVSSRLFTVKNVASCSPRSGCRYECAFIFLVVGVLAQQTFADDPEQIVGGTPAAPGEFPHQASLRVNGNHICGGSIIAPTKILTAAHCVDGIVYPPYNNLRIATGTIQINGGKLHTVSKVAVHPQYSGRREDAWRNDVAVITTATLSGWGRTTTGGSLARSLLKMNQAVVSQNQCQQYHRGMPLTGSHLCTLNRFGIGACQGDSGGPLISNGVQIGITSWVLPCAQGVPDVYTDVFYHRQFIRYALLLRSCTQIPQQTQKD